MDDDPDILMMLSGLLASRLPGLPVRVATSAEEALAMVRSQTPKVIVADYRMPGMDGVAFLRQARILAPHARLVMLAGAPDQFAAAAGRASAYSVLSKPIEAELFLKLIQAKVPTTPENE